MINVPQELYIKCYPLILYNRNDQKKVLQICSSGRGFQRQGQGFSGGRVGQGFS